MPYGDCELAELLLTLDDDELLLLAELLDTELLDTELLLLAELLLTLDDSELLELDELLDELLELSSSSCRPNRTTL